VDVTHSAPDEYPTPAPDDTGANSADMDANSADPDSVDSDPVDTTDTDVWEALTQGMDAAFDPDQRHTSDVLSSIPPSSEVPRSSTPPPDPPIQVDDSNTTNSQTELTIDSFLHGCPGAQIVGASQGQSDHQSREALDTSTWAPFHSKCDWDIALWAKLRGLSSTAFTELLQIPEVRFE
jgi:hypothetical protein